ncbi:vitellogenin-2 protein [Spatholobus suberectus]|nr:vitellogenin-2 protein [Spatholobus suberectus]
MESPKANPKTRGKFRLFQCFKPYDVVSPRRKAERADPLLAYIAVAEKQRMVLPAVLTSAFAAAKGAAGEENMSRREKTGRENNNSLRRALMAALSHAPLVKKMNRKRKTSKDCFSRESTSNLSSNTTSSSRSSLAFTPSSLSSSTSSSTTSTGTQTSGSSSEPYLSRSLAINGTGVAKEMQNIGDSRKGYFGSNMAVCLLLITSLLVLIVWGRCCAIAYTSIGFFVVPNRRRRPCNEGAVCEETDFSTSVRYKK